VSFNLNLKSQSLFTGTWQKRPGELDHRLRFEIEKHVTQVRGTPVTKSMLYLCDNQALLKAVKRWVGEGAKATLV